MRFFLQLLCVVVLVAGGLTSEAGESEGPVYQRHRGGGGYGGPAAYGPYPGYPPGFPPYGLGYFQQPFAGDWFTRPYPSHLEYFRLRQRASPASQDCPCANTPTGQ